MNNTEIESMLALVDLFLERVSTKEQSYALPMNSLRLELIDLIKSRVPHTTDFTKLNPTLDMLMIAFERAGFPPGSFKKLLDAFADISQLHSATAYPSRC